MRSSALIHNEMMNIEKTITKFSSIQNQYIDMLSIARKVDSSISSIGKSVRSCESNISSGGYIVHPNHIDNKLTNIIDKINRFESNLVLIENECNKKINYYDEEKNNLSKEIENLRYLYWEALKKERAGKK